jgi:ABC-type sugar transport system ATPase subunit
LSGDARQRISTGLAFVSGDRSRTLIGDWSLAENYALPGLAVRSAVAPLRQGAMIRSTERMIERLEVKGTATQQLKELSGGNQQKVALGRWLGRSGVCLLADDPTRGVDVRGRRAIHEALIAFCADGNSVLVSSVDPEELVELCTRVLVMVEGQIVEELRGKTLVVQRLEAATRMRSQISEVRL